MGLGPQHIRADTHRVLIRSWFTNATTVREGTFWLWFPEYIVTCTTSFGPWASHERLPAKGQVCEIDVPEALIPVDNGTYTLKVNTKVVGHVENYTVEDLLLNPMPIEDHMHNVITDMLRSAVHDKTLEMAITEIQEIFTKDLHNRLKDLTTATFRPTRLMLDANQSIAPANKTTEEAMQLVAQRKQQVAQRALHAEEHVTAMQKLENELVLKAEEQRRAHITAMRELENQLALRTEEQRLAHITAMREQENQLTLKAEEQKVHALILQMHRDELMLQKEVYGMEGAAQIEATNHAKAAYLLSGIPGSNVWTTLPAP